TEIMNRPSARPKIVRLFLKKQPSNRKCPVSTCPSTTDIRRGERHVRFVPQNPTSPSCDLMSAPFVLQVQSAAPDALLAPARAAPRSRRARSAFRGHPGHECARRVRPDGNAPEIGYVERRPDDPATMALDLGNASIDVVDFEIAQPGWRV